MCLADHLNVRPNLLLPFRSRSCLAVWRMLAARCCPDLFISDLMATSAAWLSMLSTHFTLFLGSVLMRWRPIIIPTSLALYTVCWSVVPRWSFSIWSLPSHLRIGAMPTLLSCAEPSKYTFTFSIAFVSTLFESSCSSLILVGIPVEVSQVMSHVIPLMMQ
jgi:hypothetical protein